MRKQLLLLAGLFILLAHTSLAQKIITGKVTDDQGIPLGNVSVIVRGTTAGTTTKTDGTYTLILPANAKALIFSSVDMRTVEISIGTNTQVNATLKSEDKTLAEVVVTGYGTQKKKDLTGSIASLKSSAIQNRPIQGPDQALRGQIAGVTVNQSSGTPGGSINVNIRGTGSINASSQPLYVIDGIPINTGSYSQIGVGNQTLNSLSEINPNEIESYEVLKDAAASAIYGSRAANGVVLITTKRGVNRKTSININTYYGSARVYKKIEPLTGPEFIELIQEGVKNRYGSTTIPSQIGLVGYDNAPSSYPTNNWQNLIFQQAPIKSLDINARGGNDRTKFFVSASVFDQQGIVIASKFKRYNFRLNLDNKVSEKLNISADISFGHSINNRIRNDNNIYGVVSTSLLLGSYFPAYNANGTYGRDPNASIENPLANAYEVTNDVKSNRLLTTVSGEYKITKHFSFKSQLSVDYLNLKELFYIPSTHLQGAGTRGDGSEGYTQDISWTNENILTYKQIFGKHDLAFTGVASYQESVYESIFAQAQNFPGDQIRRLSAGSVRVAASSSGTSWGLVGYIGRVNYAYAGKYLFGASMRRDGVSRFGSNKRWGTFPAVSVAWRISEEKFLSNVNFISDLKIRGSYGLAGNASVGNFASLPLVGGGFNFNQAAGLAPIQLGNPDLGWEESKQKDIALELGLFKNRINIIAEYYVKNTKNLLLARPLVGSSGFTSITENIGELQNKGLELTLNADVFKRTEFNWSTSFNITYPKNNVVKLAGAPFASGFASWVEVGQNVGAFRGFVVKGIFQSQAEITAAPVQSSLTRPGDIQFEDLNKDGRITTEDQRIIGSAVPKYFGGWTNNFSYKGFALNIFIQFVQGNSVYNNTRAFSEGMNSIFGQAASTRNRWTPTKTTGNLPRAVFGDPNNNRRTSTRWLEDGSFTRLKNLTLSYSLPQSVVSKFKLASFRFFVQGENLYTWTKYSGFDPEVSTFSVTNTAPGTDFLTFPQARTLTFGLNIGF
jgi:TonB-linked SusC/RagA family outer membrane protein